MPLTTEGKQLPRTGENDAREIATSGQLVRLIDVLYGLGVVQAALSYRSIFGTPSRMSLQVILALVLIYYTIARSFIDWHTAMEAGRYRIMTKTYRRSELVRVYTDFAIVATYAFMLFKAHPLLHAPAAGLRVFFWTFPFLFVLYLVWGRLRRYAHDEQPFKESLLWVCVGLWVALAGVYEYLFDSCDLNHKSLNTVALAIALVVMAFYRHENWKQQDEIDDALPTPVADGAPPGAVRDNEV